MLLSAEGLTVKKRFGQNFLINSDARKRIVDALGIAGGELVWEIGPGIGSLTSRLVRENIRLVVFEIDHGFARVLKDAYSSSTDFSIVEGDFIKTWQEAYGRSGEPDLIVGNLPYSCASAIFLTLIEGGVQARRMICTVQREAALRMTAQPGSSEYSSFSALCALTWKIERLGDLKAGSFYPPPRVRSTILSLEPRKRTQAVPAVQLLAGVRAIFAGRRKTIRNNLRMAVSKIDMNPRELLEEVDSSGFDLDQRPETLSPERVENLAGILCKYLTVLGDQGTVEK
jgi:16S rRNA (adenine1518-N6/adenine1519-N6)-dimethyltransferase